MPRGAIIELPLENQGALLGRVYFESASTGASRLSLQQGPSRQAAPAAQQRLRQQAAPARQAARRQVRAAVSDPDCSWPAPGRPSGSGSAGAMSRVGGALREQRGGGCVRLGERCASWAACQSWHSRYAGTTSRPLCTSGLFWSGVEPVGTPDQNSPEVQRRSAVVPRAAVARFCWAKGRWIFEKRSTADQECDCAGRSSIDCRVARPHC
jgi:hypothetical protein